MEQQLINISACAAGILVLVLSAYGFYKAGWNARNIEQNNYLYKQVEYYKELYEKEKEAKKQSILNNCRIIKKLYNKIFTYDQALKDNIDKIDSGVIDEHFPHIKK